MSRVATQVLLGALLAAILCLTIDVWRIRVAVEAIRSETAGEPATECRAHGVVL